MPHLPDHLTHDPELVAAYAAGDATGSDLALATELVADCTACAALHRDLRAIATALPELPAPARTRDFRLTPTQAASLAPSGWRGVLAAFASPRFRLAAPLGTGLAAIGIAGLLLGTTGTMLPAGSGNAASAGVAAESVGLGGATLSDGGGSITQRAPVPNEQPAPSGEAASAAALAPEAAVATGAAPTGLADGLTGAASPVASGGRNSTGSELAAPPEAASQDAQPLVLGTEPSAKASDAAEAGADIGGPAGSPVILVLAAGLLVAGSALIVLRFAARRLA
jgi:hypothetical protein